MPRSPFVLAVIPISAISIVVEIVVVVERGAASMVIYRRKGIKRDMRRGSHNNRRLYVNRRRQRFDIGPLRGDGGRTASKKKRYNNYYECLILQTVSHIDLPLQWVGSVYSANVLPDRFSILPRLTGCQVSTLVYLCALKSVFWCALSLTIEAAAS